VFDMSPEFRHQLAADRMASLRRSAEPSPNRPLRRALGSGLVRLGLRLGYDGHPPRPVSLPGTDTAATPQRQSFPRLHRG
jgi:hypothetical protein